MLIICKYLCDYVQINCSGVDIPNTDFEAKLYRGEMFPLCIVLVFVNNNEGVLPLPEQ